MRRDGFDISYLDEEVEGKEVKKETRKEVKKNFEEKNDNIINSKDDKKDKILNINSLSIQTKINKNIDDNIKKNKIDNIKKDLINKSSLDREETRGRKKSKNKKSKTFTSKLYGKQKDTIDSIKEELDIETDYELLLFLLKKSTVRNNIDVDLFLIK